MNKVKKINFNIGKVTPFIKLRTKGYVAYGALTVFAFLLSIFILYQKSVLLEQVDLLQNAYETENRLNELENNIMARYPNDVVITTLSDKDVKLLGQSLKNIYQESILKTPFANSDITRLGKEMEKLGTGLLNRDPQTLSYSINHLKTLIAYNLNSRKHFREKLVQDFRERSDFVAMTSLAFGLLGLTLFGSISGIFFTRLTSDILNLKKRAEEIVSGVRSYEPLPMKRNDEVGHLGDAVNHMAVELEQYEKNLEIERHKYFHQEKMAAIGALSAGIAHEVGNPIAAISALVREVKEEKLKQDKLNGALASTEKQGVCKLDVILEHTERLSGITREIQEFARPQSTQRVLLDINSLIKNTCKFMQYDKRWKKINMTLELDNTIPAIEAVADQITQVIMNVLVNSADALEDSSSSIPYIDISSSMQDQFVVISIQDNGHGMSGETLKKARETFFTTKASGKGTGLGLSLCQSIISAHHGRLKIDSEYMKGTIVNIYLPVPVPEAIVLEANSHA